MTFPAPEVLSAPDEDREPEEAQAPREFSVVVGGCAGCDGSGLWRGIDGFVFVCQHCCFEMT